MRILNITVLEIICPSQTVGSEEIILNSIIIKNPNIMDFKLLNLWDSFCRLLNKLMSSVTTKTVQSLILRVKN